MSWPWNLGQRSLKVIESSTIWQIVYGFLVLFYSNFVHNMHSFWDIRLVTIHWPWNPGYGSLKVIGTDTNRFVTYDFLLTFHSNNHGPILYRFRDIRRFQSKIAKFSHPFYFASPLKGFTLELDTGAGVKKTRMMGNRAAKKSLSIAFAVWTDGQTDTGQQQRPRLRIAIASRGKNHIFSPATDNKGSQLDVNVFNHVPYISAVLDQFPPTSTGSRSKTNTSKQV